MKKEKIIMFLLWFKEIAQKYAEKLGAKQIFEHSHAKFKSDHMEENVYMLMLHVQSGRPINAKSTVKLLNDEISCYNFDNPLQSTGIVCHFIQVVW